MVFSETFLNRLDKKKNDKNSVNVDFIVSESFRDYINKGCLNRNVFIFNNGSLNIKTEIKEFPPNKILIKVFIAHKHPVYEYSGNIVEERLNREFPDKQYYWTVILKSSTEGIFNKVFEYQISLQDKSFILEE